MALAAKYKQFLVRPSEELLAPNASFDYIPTLTSINESAAILRHLTAQTKLLDKKSEKILNVFEGSDALCAEIETTLEFNRGGGAYLPGLDDNFLADHTVNFPVVHIVTFTDDQRILHVRLHWDQGSLLKAVDVIGSRAKNWPIRDGREQSRLIAFTSKVQQPPASAASSRRSTASNVSNATHDPHKSLDLFTPNEVSDSELPAKLKRPSIAPRTSAKPPARGLEQILGGEDMGTPVGQRERSPAKGGAGKNYRPNRLFDENDPLENRSPERSVKTNPNKYSHFEFGDGEDALPTRKKKEVGPDGSEQKDKHQSQWDFEDFVTPNKAGQKVRHNDQRHIGWSDDEEAEESPVRRQVIHLPRPDAKTHFEFADELTPVPEKKQAAVIGRTKQALSLYADPVFGGEEETTGNKAMPLQTTTNVNNQARGKDFGSHYEFTDDSPSLTRKPDGKGGNNNSNSANANGNGNGHAVQSRPDEKKHNPSHLDSHWSMYDDSPSGRKENVPAGGQPRKQGGDGMGGRKGGSRGWGIGDDSDEEGVRAQPTRRTGTSERKEKNFWDF